MKSYGNLAESFQRFCAVSGIAERNPRIQPGNIVLTMFHTRIHEKQDNCLVLIAPTARWILRKRTDAQSAAVPMKLSYFHGKVVSGMARELFPDNYNTDTRFCKLYFAEQETK